MDIQIYAHMCVHRCICACKRAHLYGVDPPLRLQHVFALVRIHFPGEQFLALGLHLRQLRAKAGRHALLGGLERVRHVRSGQREVGEHAAPTARPSAGGRTDEECARRGDESGGVASGRCAPRPPLQGRASKAGTTARTKGIVSTRILRRPLRSSLTLALARVYVPCMLPTPFCSPRVDAPSLQGDRRGPGRDASRGRILWSGAKTFAGIEFFPPLSPSRTGQAERKRSVPGCRLPVQSSAR